MKLPERDALIAAVRGMRDDCCLDCDCENKPDFHQPECSSFVPVRLQINDGDWDLLHGETPSASWTSSSKSASSRRLSWTSGRSRPSWSSGVNALSPRVYAHISGITFGKRDIAYRET